jgi:hypothetical protein
MATEHEQLVEFLDSTLDLLEDVVQHPNNLIYAEFQAQLKRAWTEFSQEFDLNEARALVRALSQSRLRSFGLIGEQLKLKLQVITKWTEIFGGKRGKAILKKLLDAIDTLLESLLLAAGLSEALKEIKEAISNLLDIPEDE